MIYPTVPVAGPPPYRSVQRDGNELFVPRAHLGGHPGVQFPPFCVKCGAPSTSPLQRSYYWHEPWLYITILAGVLIYAILAIVARKRLDVLVPMCAEHRRRRRRSILAAWLVALGGVALPIALASLGVETAWTFLLIPVGLLAGAIMGTIGASPLAPTRIDESGGTFKGAGAAFLEKLPDR